MAYATCNTCGRFGRTEFHRCPPVWSWRCDDWHGPDDWSDVRADDAESAAEEAAGLYDQEDYPLLRGNEVTIIVRSPEGIVSRWTCTGESVPQYSATELEDEDPTHAD